MVDFADANKDGKVDPKEVQSAIRLGKFLKRVAGGDLRKGIRLGGTVIP